MSKKIDLANANVFLCNGAGEKSLKLGKYKFIPKETVELKHKPVDGSVKIFLTDKLTGERKELIQGEDFSINGKEIKIHTKSKN